MKWSVAAVAALTIISLALIGVGAAHLGASRRGAPPAPPGPTPTIEEVRRITPTELHAKLRGLKRPVVWDVRSAEAFAAGHIPGAQQVRLADIPARAQQLDRNQLIVTVCA